MARRARFEEIADDLREAIVRGDYRPGDALPKLDDLAATFTVSRDTVLNAIRALREEGWLEVRRGQGTFLRFGRVVACRYRPDMPRGGPWTTTIATAGRSGSIRPLGVEMITAGRREASWLQIPIGTEVIVRRRHLIDSKGEPIQLYDSYLPRELVKDSSLGGPTVAHGGVYRSLERIGHPPTQMGEEISARMPTPSEASVLRLGKRTPVLEVVRVTRDESGQVVEALHIVAAADRNVLVYDGLPIARGQY